MGKDYNWRTGKWERREKKLESRKKKRKFKIHNKGLAALYKSLIQKGVKHGDTRK